MLPGEEFSAEEEGWKRITKSPHEDVLLAETTGSTVRPCEFITEDSSVRGKCRKQEEVEKEGPR